MIWPKLLATVQMSENDKRLLLVLLFIFMILFILIGLIGMGIRTLTKKFAARVDNEMADCVRFGVVTDAKHYKELGKKKNNRIYFKQSSPAMLVALTSVIVLLLYCIITGNWGKNFWGEWGDLIYYPIFQEEDFVIFWGNRVLARWPQVWHAPEWHNSNIISYFLVTMWIVSICYMTVCTHAYVARMLQINRRARTIYDKNMDDYNYYDHVNGAVDPMSAAIKYNQTQNQNQQQNPPQNPYQNPNDPNNWRR